MQQGKGSTAGQAPSGSSKYSSSKYSSSKYSGEDSSSEGRTVRCEHGVTRELFMIALVIAMGVLATVVIVLPAVVTI